MPPSLTNMLCDLVFNANLAKLVNTPTHFKGSTFDIVIIIDYLWIFDLFVLLKNHRSFQINHLLVEFSVRSSSIPFNKSPTKFFLNYAIGDYVVICANEFLASRYEL